MPVAGGCSYADKKLGKEGKREICVGALLLLVISALMDAYLLTPTLLALTDGWMGAVRECASLPTRPTQISYIVRQNEIIS